jgi:hypothetical protein
MLRRSHDLLFLLGSLMDAVMGDLNVDDVPIGCVVSSSVLMMVLSTFLSERDKSRTKL